MLQLCCGGGGGGGGGGCGGGGGGGCGPVDMETRYKLDGSEFEPQ
jgi:hypothetical protein